jgi:chemotaxis protein methyltransferase CheR
LDVGRSFPSLALRIVATDVGEEVLSRARRGCYGESSLRELPSDWRDSAFERVGELWCVRPELREGIEFRREDVRERMPDGPLHVVLCRYLVFTYFDERSQRTLAEGLARRPGSRWRARGRNARTRPAGRGGAGTVRCGHARVSLRGLR